MGEQVTKTTASGIVYYDKPDPPKPPEPEPLTDSEVLQGVKLLDSFLAMPVSAQVEVFALLKKSFMWRGWDSMYPATMGRQSYIPRMADVFAKNGHSQPEYT